MEDFTREELQEIEQRATAMASNVKNQFWIRAYLNLTDACDRLDAMIARSEDVMAKDVSGIAIKGSRELNESNS